jgi:hypothetical protein
MTQERAASLVYVFHNIRSLKHLSIREEEKLNRMEADASRAMDDLVSEESSDSPASDTDSVLDF